MNAARRAIVTIMGLALLLVACGGSDPTATPEPTETATATTAPAPAAPSPTATEAAATSTATPQATATITPTPPPPTPRPIATQAPTATVEPTPTPDPVVERAELLSLALIDERSLPDGWVLTDSEIRFEADPEQVTICDLHEYEGRAELVADVSADFSSPDGMQFFGYSITEYPMITAFQALSFARAQVSECGEWTSEDGITFQLEPVLMDLPTSDGHAHSVRFTIEDQQFDGRWVFMRVFNYVLTFAFFAPEGSDIAPMEEAIFDAVPRMQVISNTLDEPEYYDDLDLAILTSMQLMSRRETLSLPERWLEYGVTIPEGEQRYNVCGLDLFTERFGALMELQNEFIVDRDAGPYLWQSIATFDDEDIAVDAMTYIRDSVSCTEFPDNSGNIWQVTGYPELPFGDESHTALVSFDSADGAARGAFVFVRSGEQITVIVYASLGDTLDETRVTDITGVAVAEMERLRR